MGVNYETTNAGEKADCRIKTTVLLPSYNPSEKLAEVVGKLAEAGFDDILVVDDGSRAECAEFFNAAEKIDGCTVIHHEGNKGKGRGLKTGIEYVLKNRAESDGVVTTDDDGQHAAADIVRCARRMSAEGVCVMGARDFTAENVPAQSRLGNKLTSFVFRHFCGIKITDTQTGLRALPRKYLEALLSVGGERFEYETNMLLEMKRLSIPFTEEKIQTIYIGNNSSSHFNPLTDSLKIYGVIAKFLLSSVSCSVIDIGMFTLLNLGLVGLLGDEGLRVFTATAGARVVSSLVNYTLNRRRVFGSEKSVARSMARYYALCAVQLLVSFLCVNGLTLLFGAEQSLWQSLIKAVTDTVLFFISFGIQRDWVYR